jgi:uncharacterized cupredoxin-like copper-binding protein
MSQSVLSRREALRLAGAATVGGLVGSLGQPGQVPQAHAQKDPFKADLTVFIGEFYFEVGDPDGKNRKGKNAAISVPAGQEFLIHFINEGAALHEIHIGRKPNLEKQLYDENLFGNTGFLGLHLDAKQAGFLHLNIPAVAKGDWEIGCFVPGHYTPGNMKAVFKVN